MPFAECIDMGQRIIRVTDELLHHILLLPADAMVVDFARDIVAQSRDYLVTVESATFPETAGERISYVSACYRRTNEKAEFAGWV